MKRTVREVVDRNQCTGCSLCYNVCKVNAINMKQSKEGFYVPEINKDNCVNCGECIEICPINERTESSNAEYLGIYAAKSTNEQIRKQSSSGGIFAELARDILNCNGIIFGAAFDNEITLRHTYIDAEKDLYILMGSKYIQSYIGKSYKEAVRFLNEGRKVMFVGTPCQIHALTRYVRDLKNLITIDLVCHGVPSQKIFNKYLACYFKEYEIASISFRDKSKSGWKNFGIRIQGPKLDYIKPHKKDTFFYGYLKNYYLNAICYKCPFSKIPRVSDITLGDFWGVPESLDDDLGTSVIIVNSQKGNNLLTRIIRKGNVIAKRIDLNQAVKYNPRINNGNLYIPKEREAIFNEIDNLSFIDIEKNFIKLPDDEMKKEAIHNINNKHVMIFGTGNIAEELLKMLKDVKIKYFLDNNMQKWGKTFNGIEIIDPHKINSEIIDDIFIIVASSHYNEIKEQLNQLGLIEGSNFIDGSSYFLF